MPDHAGPEHEMRDTRLQGAPDHEILRKPLTKDRERHEARRPENESHLRAVNECVWVDEGVPIGCIILCVVHVLRHLQDAVPARMQIVFEAGYVKHFEALGPLYREFQKHLLNTDVVEDLVKRGRWQHLEYLHSHLPQAQVLFSPNVLHHAPSFAEGADCGRDAKAGEKRVAVETDAALRLVLQCVEVCHHVLDVQLLQLVNVKREGLILALERQE
mmetsp:Transcript_9525/g.24878  ORF Transcript_9525/g.24878 Transcript_9525/m.24878 type:complete len:216 (-) Transcript_9525:120-767(-)